MFQILSISGKIEENMASVPASGESYNVERGTAEKFTEIFCSEKDAVRVLNVERTVQKIKPRLFACALGTYSYSSGIHRIRLKMESGHSFFGIRSRSIPPVPNDLDGGSYVGSSSTYGWEHLLSRVLNGKRHRYAMDLIMKTLAEPNLHGHVYTITLNCDEHRISMVNENNKAKDEIEIDISYAPFPWCLFVELPTSGGRVSLI